MRSILDFVLTAAKVHKVFVTLTALAAWLAGFLQGIDSVWAFLLGAGAAVVVMLSFAVWSWFQEGRQGAQPKQPPPSGHRTGIDIEGGSLTDDGSSIKNQDSGIKAKGTKVVLNNTEIS